MHVEQRERRHSDCLRVPGRDEEAVTALRRVLERFPALLDARYELGQALARLGRYAESYEAYREALRSSPSLATAISPDLARVSPPKVPTEPLDLHFAETPLHRKLGVFETPNYNVVFTKGLGDDRKPVHFGIEFTNPLFEPFAFKRAKFRTFLFPLSLAFGKLIE